MKRAIFTLTLLVLHASLTRELHAADTIIKPGTSNNPGAGKNMYLQTADNHLVPATVVYTTDGNGNIVPVSSSISNINIGQVNQGTSNDGASPWHVLDDQTLAKWNLFLPKFDVNLSTLASQATLQSVLSKLDVNLSSVATQATLATLSGNVVHADTGNVTVASSALPSGAASATNQITQQTTLGSLDTKTPTLGQKAMAGSRPVVLATDQSAIPTKLQDGTGNALGSTSGALNVNVANTVVPIQGGNTTAVKVDGSSVTQPVSAIALPLPSGASSEATLSSLNTKVTTTTNGVKVDGSGATQPVSGTVTANAGTGTFSVAGTLNSKLQDGNGNVVTSQSSAFQRALDVGVNVAGVQVDPRQVRALTAADVVTSRLQDGSGAAINSQAIGGSQYLAVTPVTAGTQGSAIPVRVNLVGGKDTSGNLQPNLLDTLGRQILLTTSEAATAAGQMFTLTTDQVTINNTNENNILLITNPAASGKIMKIDQLIFGVPTNGGGAGPGVGAQYRYYSGPTITTNGTALTPVGSRQTGQAANVVNFFRQPTTSARGTLAMTYGLSTTGPDLVVEKKFSLWIDPGSSVLITSQQDNNPLPSRVTVSFKLE